MQKSDKIMRVEPSFALVSAKFRLVTVLVREGGKPGPQKLQAKGVRRVVGPLPDRCYADHPTTDGGDWCLCRPEILG